MQFTHHVKERSILVKLQTIEKDVNLYPQILENSSHSIVKKLRVSGFSERVIFWFW